MASLKLHVSLFAYIFLAFLAFAKAANNERHVIQFDVKPGGSVHEFEQEWGGYKCKFSFACQGGTKENWEMEITEGIKDTVGCSVARPGGMSYLFFQQFHLELQGAEVTSAMAFADPSKELKPQEFHLDKDKGAVTQVDGKFDAKLCRAEIYGKKAKAADSPNQEL